MTVPIHNRGKELDPLSQDSIMRDITQPRGLRIVRTIPLDMDVPAMRRDVTNRSNVAWLLRNLAVRNSEHSQFNSVIETLKKKASEFKS